MAFSTFINAISLENIIFKMRVYVLILLLTCLQEAQIIALPTGNVTAFITTHISTTALIISTSKTTNTIQYPPTTIVQNTVPATKGVSSCSHTSSREH